MPRTPNPSYASFSGVKYIFLASRSPGASRHHWKVQRWRSHRRTVLDGTSLRDELCALDSVSLGLEMDNDVVKGRRSSTWPLSLGCHTGKEGKEDAAGGRTGHLGGTPRAN
ncbi:hypothetical protein K443DRAFT_364959 [Laccaria amethystina LaAM-08-1]|uniref:Uncharacterized protein n=1 Tax=Laccaria amethystina LaAM-08-1 TaxID=1095629 RepID=A0A0C9X999_9AGAR|nr:hypothetical protein K443DRAFT_364959 [Laccaria amethystina LaAM-08-1]